MEWFKFYGSQYLNDLKMLSLSPAERSCWITLLCFASVEEAGGTIRFLTEDRLMTSAGLEPTREEWNDTSGVLEKFKKLGMITDDNEDDNAVITITNWKKRQGTSLTGYERLKRYREKNKMITYDNDDDTKMITIEEKRKEKNTCEDESSQESEKEKEPIKEVRETIGDDKPVRKKVVTPEMQEVFDLFSSNPDRFMWKLKPLEREAALILHKTFGMRTLLGRYKVMQKEKGQDMCPQVNSPTEMLRKMPAFENYLLKNKPL